MLTNAGYIFSVWALKTISEGGKGLVGG